MVTAGNSSQVTDGAVALLVCTEAVAEKLGITPLGRLVSHAYTGCDPARCPYCDRGTLRLVGVALTDNHERGP